METTLASKTVAAPLPQASAASLLLNIPWFIYATVFASLCIVVGLIWDISWHMSIGRDGLLSPPHLAMYLGAIIAGTFSGYQVLQTTFAGKEVQKKQSVRFWGIFYSSLGALFCIWGALAMLTSAPFDDWWHDTYGLDVTILSPPHTVLALGMMTIQFGAIISVLALQNRTDATDLPVDLQQRRQRRLQVFYIIAAGFFLTMLFIIASEFQGRHDMHRSSFYIIGGGLYTFLLSAIARSSPLKWAATATTAVYMTVLMLMNWILPLFSAKPMLGPILNHIDHFQAFDFPLLLIFPALTIDGVLNRFRGKNDWLQALVIAVLFIGVFAAVQWPFGDFLMSPYARNGFFGTETWYFSNNPDWEYRYAFAPWMETTGWNLVVGLLTAVGVSVLTTRLGLYWGRWMQQVRR
ncbi:hypothetical protein [Tunicatimonas pelagia]|uniref:hypothetical protein n=1 Tax=Tunicatimonas pelagia TaxID=931531 RepID=UPI00266548A3|nr:hypothetical protein [Tunicatimonas pelagia]WKN42968.1 hypothetical protein P0M28_28420 [Tunicatimonas pelagia]